MQRVIHGLEALFIGGVSWVLWVLWNRTKPQQEVALEAMYDTLNVKSPYFCNHSRRVALLSASICDVLKVSRQEKAEILSAAKLHDVGKLFIDERLLNSIMPLSKEEWEIIKSHPVSGATMAEKFGISQTICGMVLAHHENIDGTGYPLGLKENEISLGARILRIADSIDAMAMPRPYRGSMSFHVLVKELKEKAGKWYDERIVKLILEGNELSQRIRLIVLNNY